TRLRDGLARKLPNYMIPSIFVLMDRLPQTPSGKTDRLRLPEVAESRPEIATQFTPPRTGLERVLIQIWRDGLKGRWLGVNHNFVEAGGDSLLALRVIAQIKTTLGVDLSVASLFEAPTVAATAAAISRMTVPAVPHTYPER